MAPENTYEIEGFLVADQAWFLQSWTIKIGILAVNCLKNSGIGFTGRGPLRENP